MKGSKQLASALAISMLVVMTLIGCASDYRNTKSLLSAAGFRTQTPTTPEERASFAAMPDRRIERFEKNGKVIFAFADKRNGIVYIGNETAYQRFHQLGLQQRIANEQLQAAQMNESASLNWAFWGPPGFWW